jgi:hypothetical protein
VSQSLETTIEKSKRLLADVVDDFKPIDQQTWNRAIMFLRSLAVRSSKDRGEILPVPHIGPGGQGSIDLYWNLDTSSAMLINFPSNSDLCTFYGYRKTTSLKGTMEITGDTFKSAILELLCPYRVRTYDV